MRFLLVLIIATFAVAAGCGSDTATSPTSTEGTATPSSPSIPASFDRPGPSVLTPEFTLPAASGEQVSLSDYRGQQPLVLVFYRGFF